MGLNYVVKKINEAKIEERFIRMLQKASTTQSTQVNGPLIAVETAKTPQRLSPPGISLVFNQDENRRRTDPYNLILKPPKDWKIEVPPLNAYKSMDTINVISIPSDDRTENDSIPLKKIASDRVAFKATSYTVTEKVLVKNNEFGRRAGKENSSITNKSDSYVTELITVKKNEHGHVAGIGTLPIIRKDPSGLVAENNTNRITSRTSSPTIHINDVIQGVTAKESTVRMESSSAKAEESTSNEPKDSSIAKAEESTSNEPKDSSSAKAEESTSNEPNNSSSAKAEESTSNEPKNSVAENIPLTNIYSARMVTNARNIVEVTMKKPKLLDDKKSNEEIVFGCSIKKSVDSILSKIANLTNKNEDLRREKSLTETYVAKQSSSFTESSRKINEISYIEKKESSCIAAKETLSHSQNDRVGENTVKKRESGPIVAKQTSLHARIERHVKDFLSVKMSVTINSAKATPARTQSDITVNKYFPIKRSESGSNVAEISLIDTSDSSRVIVKAKSLRAILVEKKNEYTDSTVIAEIANTSKTTNVDPVKEIPFTDKIKALLKDENVMDVMLYKPSSSTKK